MLAKFVILLICTLSMSLTVCSQEVKELKQIESYIEFKDLYEKTVPIIETDTIATIKLYEDAFYKTDNYYTKSAIMQILGALYTSTKQFDKCLGMCEELINSGTSVFFQIRENTFPSYTKAFENNEKYISILKRNNELVEKTNENSKAEYYIQKPNNYDDNKSYPLLMILHGGVGSIQNIQHFWSSPILTEDYLVAYIQGREFKCSTRRRYGPEGKTDIKSIFEKIKQDFSVDTLRVILGGPSAGGRLSVDLAINDHLSVQGLILAFPVKPRDFGADDIYAAGINGLRISMICGESDWAIEGQKEMSVIFDKLDLPNRIVIYPDLGHGYPDDFSNQIMKSIEYIENK